MRRIAFLLLFTLLVSSAPLAHAQFVPGITELNISLSPQNPRPYDTVTATVSSTLIDLAGADISFSLNGTVIEQGNRTATFTVGGAGSKNTISVVARDGSGAHTAQTVIRPVDVIIVQEPSTTVHPFYSGAALTAQNGGIRLIAMTDFQTSPGVRIPTANLAFTWRLGDRILESDSGLGKNVLIATAPPRYRDAKITVSVSSQDGALFGDAAATVTPASPTVLVYKNDPLAGIDFAHAFSTLVPLVGDEETFRAVPFYFGAAPTVSWTLNGAESGSDPDLTVRSSGGNGTALIGASAVSGAGEHSETRFTLEFSAPKSTGIFGL